MKEKISKIRKKIPKIRQETYNNGCKTFSNNI